MQLAIKTTSQSRHDRMFELLRQSGQSDLTQSRLKKVGHAGRTTDFFDTFRSNAVASLRMPQNH